MSLNLTIRERIQRRLVAAPDTGCLLWTGCLNSRGYGCIGFGGKTYLVHRVVWMLSNGPIPDGLTIDHVHARGCRYKHCGNLAHLEAVTSGENTRRGRAVRPAVYRPRRSRRPDPDPEYLAILNALCGPEPGLPVASPEALAAYLEANPC